MKPEIRENLKRVLEDLKDNSFGIINIEEHNEPEMEFIVELPMSRYEKLIACETELRMLRNALSTIRAYDLSEVMKIFGIEKKGE